jgi:hypothetical protein
MKTKLLNSALGVVLLGTSVLALAGNGSGHDHGRSLAYHGPAGGGGHGYGAPHQWSRHPGPAHYVGPPHWRGPVWRHPGWHAPYRHYVPAPRHYGRYDDGVTIIFKGRID